ncbi:hypothetical protein [Nonomuraea dietziae]|uniref:hypothetical protein n=1 Tax=Nonomuraea dietziae TaxID=65515 RepID=UPI0031D53002
MTSTPSDRPRSQRATAALDLGGEVGGGGLSPGHDVAAQLAQHPGVQARLGDARALVDQGPELHALRDREARPGTAPDHADDLDVVTGLRHPARLSQDGADGAARAVRVEEQVADLHV